MAVENDFLQGIELAGLDQVNGTQLDQLVQNATPTSTKAIIIVQDDSPDIINNPRYTRYLWLDTSGATPILKRYNSDTPAWESVVTGTNTVTTNSIQDLAVTLAKLSPEGGTALQLIRVNAAGTAFEFFTLDLSTATAAGVTPSATAYDVLITNSSHTASQWMSVANLLAALGAVVPLGSLVQAGATSGQAIAWNGTTWAPANIGPFAGIAATGAPVTGDLFLLQRASVSYSITIANLMSYISSTLTTAGTITAATSSLIAVPSAGASVTPVPHGLDRIPILLRMVLVNQSAEGGYSVDDEIDISCIYANSGIPAFSFWADADNVYATRTSDGGFAVANGSGGAPFDISSTTANWRLKFYWG